MGHTESVAAAAVEIWRAAGGGSLDGLMSTVMAHPGGTGPHGLDDVREAAIGMTTESERDGAAWVSTPRREGWDPARRIMR